MGCGGVVWVLECRRRMHSTMQHADKHISHCLDRSWEWLERLSACLSLPGTFVSGSRSLMCVCVREGGATVSFNTRCSNETGVKGGADKAMGRERVRATRWQVYQRKHFTAGMGSQVKCQHLSRWRRHPFTRQWVRTAPGKSGIGPRRSARRLTSLFSLLFFPPKHARVSCSVCFFH